MEVISLGGVTPLFPLLLFHLREVLMWSVPVVCSKSVPIDLEFTKHQLYYSLQAARQLSLQTISELICDICVMRWQDRSITPKWWL